jgi:hypothetical protein
VTIVLVPRIGDFLPQGAPLFNVHDGTVVDGRRLLRAVALGKERTLHKDLAYTTGSSPCYCISRKWNYARSARAAAKSRRRNLGRTGIEPVTLGLKKSPALPTELPARVASVDGVRGYSGRAAPID